MKKIIALLIVASVVLVSIPTTFAQGKPVNPTPNVISCQTTVWVVEEASNTYSFSNGTSERVKLLALRDAYNNSFCGQVKAQNFTSSNGLCLTFTADVVWNEVILGEGTQAICSGNGFVQSPSTSVSEGIHIFALGREYVNGAYGNLLYGAVWTVS